ncbi:hypothetical protein BBJ28_00019545, partial [Nothophytophthora sp. Chile5]
MEIRGGDSLNISLETGELTVSHSETHVPGEVIWRLQPDKMITHVSAQFTEITYPSDRRIKTDIEDVDEDDILQRLQTLEVKKYRYSKLWRDMRGLPDVAVRGVIAQQVEQTFPEYVTVSTFELPEKNFSFARFHEVNKQQITMDLIAAIHAQHKRFKVGPNNNLQSGRVDISTADGGSYSNASPRGSSDGVSVGSDVVMQGGGVDSADAAQKVKIIGASNAQGAGGDVSVDGGSSSGSVGGSVLLTSGGGAVSSGEVIVSTSVVAGGGSGNISVSTGASSTSSGSVRIGSGSGAASAGVIEVAGGSSGSGVGSGISVLGGASDTLTGGSVTIHSGSSLATESGAIALSSHTGVDIVDSGVVSVSSGSTDGGSSGSVSI